MNEFLRKLAPACVFVAAVVLVTLAVLTFSPLFVAVPLAVCCAIAGHAALGPDPGRQPVAVRLPVDDATLVPGRREHRP